MRLDARMSCLLKFNVYACSKEETVQRIFVEKHSTDKTFYLQSNKITLDQSTVNKTLWRPNVSRPSGFRPRDAGPKKAAAKAMNFTK